MTEELDHAMKNDEHRKTFVQTLKEHFPDPIELIIDQIIQMFIQWYNRRILILSSLILLLLPISMMIIGILFFHSCPKSFYLPLHLIICGMTSFIAAIGFLIMSFQWKNAIKLTANFSCHKSKSMIMILSILELIFMIIGLIGSMILPIVLLQICDLYKRISLLITIVH